MPIFSRPTLASPPIIGSQSREMQTIEQIAPGFDAMLAHVPPVLVEELSLGDLCPDQTSGDDTSSQSDEIQHQ